ncbi:MAG: hypothetical protein HY924_17405 [Elusimicrobia bacterium]|nr:hypothetical protein [Elusimicrobiota bacterium]
MSADAVLIAASYHPSLEGRRAAFLFPDEDHPGVPFSQDELRSLSPAYSRLYAVLVEAAAGVLSGKLGVPKPAAEVLAREGIVSQAHFFLDRFLRLLRLVGSRPGGAWAVLAAAAPLPEDVAEFRALAQSSLAFNQALLARQAAVLSLLVQEPPEPLADPVPTPGPSTVNYNNLLGTTLLQRMGRKLAMAGWRAASRLRPSAAAPMPAHSLAYMTEPLKNAGFYAGTLEDVRRRVSLVSSPRDSGSRGALAAALEGRGAEAAAFLSAAGGLDAGQAGRAAGALTTFLVAAFPSSLLEAGSENVRRCSAVLAPFAPGPLLIAEAGTLEPALMVAGARAAGMDVVGVQYGGHHSYMDDHVWPSELMYPDYQTYVTWGWDTRPDGESCREVRLMPLPSPWLSERGRFWRASLAKAVAADKEFDFLWFTNKVYRFPPAPSGTAVCSIDSIAEIRAMMTGLVREARARGVRILHKPYNADTTALLAKTSSELERLGAGDYASVSRLDKGLTPALVDRARVVLWDQPGTGMLECLAGGIPTMVFWPRDYYTRERAGARELVAGLERWGLIHRTVESLFRELSDFKAGPDAWLARPERLEAAARFSRAYGWADASWARIWRESLERLRPAKAAA